MDDLQLDSHELYDPVDPATDRWAPANDPACLLVASLEACKDVVMLCSRIAAPIGGDKRGLGMLVTPVLSLAENAQRLRRLLGQENISHWPAPDREFLRSEGRELDRLLGGPLRLYRNRRAAHHDAKFVLDAAGTPTPTIELVGRPLGKSLGVLALLVNHERSFSWSRIPPDANENVVEITTEAPLSIRLAVRDDGAPELLSVALTSDPRHTAVSTIAACAEQYNRLVEGTDVPPLHLNQRTRPRR
jgi:hypothetical protein